MPGLRATGWCWQSRCNLGKSTRPKIRTDNGSIWRMLFLGSPVPVRGGSETCSGVIQVQVKGRSVRPPLLTPLSRHHESLQETEKRCKRRWSSHFDVVRCAISYGTLDWLALENVIVHALICYIQSRSPHFTLLTRPPSNTTPNMPQIHPPTWSLHLKVA